jgi:hypothetical protein
MSMSGIIRSVWGPCSRGVPCMHARSNWFSTCAVQVNCTSKHRHGACTGKHRHGAGSWTTPPTRDASCRIEAMPELYRLETMEGALQLPCRGADGVLTSTRIRSSFTPQRSGGRAESASYITCTVELFACAHAMDSSTGDVKRRHYCNPQRLAPTLRFDGGVVHTGLNPVRDPSLGSYSLVRLQATCSMAGHIAWWGRSLLPFLSREACRVIS